MKKYVTFSTVLAVVVLAIVFVSMQTETTLNAAGTSAKSTSEKISILFYYHDTSKTEKDFVKAQIATLNAKFSDKLQIKSINLESESVGSDFVKFNISPSNSDVVCILNDKYYLTNMTAISKEIENYINFILYPDKYKNPMLRDLMSASDTNVATETTEADEEKLKCDSDLHDLLLEIDKIYTFDYIAEAEVSDVYVDVNFKKKLLKLSREDFEKALSTILDTYNFYFVHENNFYVIKEKPQIVSESFEVNSRIDFNEFISQCGRLMNKSDTLSYDSKAKLLFFNGSKDSLEKIKAFMNAIKKTYEFGDN